MLKDLEKENTMNARMQSITNLILQDYEGGRDIDQMDVFNQPEQDEVQDIVKKLLNILFPGYYREKAFRSYNYNNRLAVVIEDVTYRLIKQVKIALPYNEEYQGMNEARLEDEAREIVFAFLQKIPQIRDYVNTDMQATFDGDPAAYDIEEIVLCYPGLLASTINRLAHELFLLRVPLIPRMMTEYAHSRTGIDIHPGATIGRYFMMDHGTGIVVGETSIIGEHVKVYQGVTIGALSTRGGQRLRGAKRHPTIEDDVTIYAGASILGGETVIGRGAVIGSNVFITSSIDPGTRVAIKNQELVVKHGNRVEVKPEKTEDETWFYII